MNPLTPPSRDVTLRHVTDELRRVECHRANRRREQGRGDRGGKRLGGRRANRTRPFDRPSIHDLVRDLERVIRTDYEEREFVRDGRDIVGR